MPKISANVAKLMPKKSDYFYDNEILSDFQTRQKAALKEIKSVPAGVPDHVGMQTISPKTNVGKYLVEFASASSIHGLNHLVAPHRHPVEKFLAVLFILVALLALIFLSSLFWDRYQNNATVIVVNNDRDRFKIVKPAIFVCPIPNIEHSKISSTFEKHGIEHTPEAEQFFTFLANVDYQNMSNTPLFDKVPSSKWLEILYDLRKNIPPQLLKENDPYETWVATEKGVCLAARSVFAIYANHEYWTTNNWTVIPIRDNIRYYDRNNDGSQENFAVDSYAQFAASDPFEVLSYDVPMAEVHVQIMKRFIMSISEIKTQAKVRELTIHQRKCKFHSDNGLELWPVYTRNMCAIECRMQVIKDHCKCRPHFSRPTDGVDVCNAEQLRCIGSITKNLFLDANPPPSCGCLPNCDVVKYQIRIHETTPLYDVPTRTSYGQLLIEFPQVIYYRSLLYGFTEFLIGVGGAAGLFLGASVLSFIEIFYYVTLRICFYIKQARQKSKKKIVIHNT
ncbi:pickpocket protein 19 [Calliopsis andreniformis]|uniref:pickpocket protein 19 n=1 Tax=Calliopsis andreniformis TaxID=337506 RepID=UPI003FCEA125